MTSAWADENLFGYVRGTDTLPKGVWEIYQIVTSRDNKGGGTYHAIDTETEVEYGVTNSLSLLGGFNMQSIYSRGLTIDGYLPQDQNSGLQTQGLEVAVKYNFLSPFSDWMGFSTRLGLDFGWRDPHSGQNKEIKSFEFLLLFQKDFFDDQLILVTNIGLESTYAVRSPIPGLDAAIEWNTNPEMEIEPKIGFGANYRFAPNWFAGVEGIYEAEYETEVGRERWSFFAGPNLHYAGKFWWTTLSFIKQFDGGGLKYNGQTNTNLHLIEKTEQEARIKIGLNF